MYITFRCHCHLSPGKQYWKNELTTEDEFFSSRMSCSGRLDWCGIPRVRGRTSDTVRAGWPFPALDAALVSSVRAEGLSLLTVSSALYASDKSDALDERCESSFEVVPMTVSTGSRSISDSLNAERDSEESRSFCAEVTVAGGKSMAALSVSA